MTSSPLGRIVEIAEAGRYLAKDRGFLTVSVKGEEIGRVPLDDLGALIATSAATTTSGVLLAELANRGVPYVVCGNNFAPAAILWPVSGHHAQQRRMEVQIDSTRALAKRLWAQIVAAKIKRQAWALDRRNRPSGAFIRLAQMVRSGDPDNIEAQAAQRYWPLMMGKSFRRNIDAEGANALLNYGYTVLRAATARSIIAAGLHPGVGVFHRHPQNSMPLADDLMEPFRPVVDLAVMELLDAGVTQVTIDAKRTLAAVLLREEITTAGRTPVSTCIGRLAASLADSFQNGAPLLDFPILKQLPSENPSIADDPTE